MTEPACQTSRLTDAQARFLAFELKPKPALSRRRSGVSAERR
jgi:hypothetical protein